MPGAGAFGYDNNGDMTTRNLSGEPAQTISLNYDRTVERSFSGNFQYCQFQAREDADRATDEAELFFPNDESRREAYRHASWAAVAASQRGLEAIGLLDAHELDNAKAVRDTFRDNANNRAGLAIGLLADNTDQARALTMAALDAGLLNCIADGVVLPC